MIVLGSIARVGRWSVVIIVIGFVVVALVFIIRRGGVVVAGFRGEHFIVTCQGGLPWLVSALDCFDVVEPYSRKN